MGTIADKLRHLTETKTAIKNAITAKGVSVADSDTFRSYAIKIRDINSASLYSKIPLFSPDNITYFAVAFDGTMGDVDFAFDGDDWMYYLSSDGITWNGPFDCTRSEVVSLLLNDIDYPLRQALIKVESKGTDMRYLTIDYTSEHTYIILPGYGLSIDWYKLPSE